MEISAKRRFELVIPVDVSGESQNPCLSSITMRSRLSRQRAGEHKPILRYLVLVSIAFALLACTAAAQSKTTYTYTGNAFNPAECQLFYSPWGPGSFLCAPGSVTASVTFYDLPANYSGSESCNVTNAPCPNMEIVMAGFGGALDSSSDCQVILGTCFLGTFANFIFQNGSIVNWSVQITTGARNGTYGCNAYPGSLDFFTGSPNSSDFALNGPPSGLISTITRSGNTVTVEASVAAAVGEVVVVQGVADPTFDGTFTVTQVNSNSEFVYSQIAADATSGGGTVSLPPSCGQVDSNPGAWTLSSGTTPPLQITPPSQTGVASGAAYNGVFTATGGSGNGYSWCVLSGTQCDPNQVSPAALPQGFTLSSEGSCGNLCTNVTLTSTGTPAATQGLYPFTVQVSDSDGDVGKNEFTLVIGCPVYVGVYPGGPFSADDKPTTENATFAPITPAGPSLAAAELICGFIGFDWVQEVTTDAHPPMDSAGNILSVPYPDPPAGGYSGHPDNAYPFFWNPNDLATGTVPCTKNAPYPPFAARAETASTLLFQDCPAEPKLTPTDPAMAFTTSLVGILPSGSPSPTLQTWLWTSTFTGELEIEGTDLGGVSQRKSYFPVDPASGTGGVTVVSINGVPTPTVVVALSQTNITWVQGLTATVQVNGASGGATATGSVTVNGGGYSSTAATLENGTTNITIPPGSFALGSDLLTVTYTPDKASAATFSQASGFATVTVNSVTPQIVFAPTSSSQPYGTPITAGSLDAIAQYNGNPVGGTFVYTTGQCGGGGQVLTAGATILQAGVYSITACFTPSQVQFAATSATAPYSVTPASQSISFAPIAAQLVGATTSLSATATSGLPLAFQTLTPTVCSVSQTTATMLTLGTCTIEAMQSGGVNYNAANPVEVSFLVMGFTLTAEPTSETVKRGVLAVFLLKVTSVNGFAGNVSISCTGGPPNSVCGNFPKTVNVKANGTALALSGILFRPRDAAGTYTIIFTGISGTDTNIATAKFTVK